MTHTLHNGGLEASHFFAVRANSALRYYPPNCHTQCTKHHLSEYHNDNPLPYVEFMMGIPELEWMEAVRKRSIKYTQDVLNDILIMCRKDRLDELQASIEFLIGD